MTTAPPTGCDQALVGGTALYNFALTPTTGGFTLDDRDGSADLVTCSQDGPDFSCDPGAYYIWWSGGVDLGVLNVTGTLADVRTASGTFDVKMEGGNCHATATYTMTKD